MLSGAFCLLFMRRSEAMAQGVVAAKDVWLVLGSLAYLVLNFAIADASGSASSSNARISSVFAILCQEEKYPGCSIDPDSDYAAPVGSKQGTCIAVHRRFCLTSTSNVNCCNNISQWAIAEVCFRYTKEHVLEPKVVCRQTRRQLRTMRPTSRQEQVQTIPILLAQIPKYSKSLSVYWNDSQDTTRIFVRRENQSPFEITNKTSVIFYQAVKHEMKRLDYNGDTEKDFQTLMIRSLLPWKLHLTIQGAESLVYTYLEESSDIPSGAQQGRSFVHSSEILARFFEWRFTTSFITDCTAQCGSGWRIETAYCFNKFNGQTAHTKYCLAVRPIRVTQCQKEECEPRWNVGSFGQCQPSCGSGERFRNVNCTKVISDSLEEEVEENMCELEDKPTTSEICRGTDCLAVWVALKWGQCDSMCAPGVQRRSILCLFLNGSRAPDDSHCHGQLPPITTRPCGEACSSRWEVRTEWGECMGVCNGSRGVMHRSVSCVITTPNGVYPNAQHSYCNASTKPVAERQCNLFCSYWVTGKPSKCSVTCGEGLTVKKVECRDQSGAKSNACSDEDKPPSIDRCIMPSCPTPQRRKRRIGEFLRHSASKKEGCKDTKGVYCDQIVTANLCGKFKEHCCKCHH